MAARRAESVRMVGRLALWLLTWSLAVMEVTALKGCYETLGVTTGDIGQQDITASNKFKNFTSGMDAWCSPVADENQFIQFDMGEKTKVTRIATQGDPASGGKFIKSFAMFYSNDGKKFDVYNEDGSKKEMVFDANADAFSVKHNNLKKPITARYLRINPRTWDKGICLRTELYGCDA